MVGEWKDGKEWNTEHYSKEGVVLGIWENGKWILKWGVLYYGMRNSEWGFYTKKWDEIDSEENKDTSIYVGEIKNGKPNGKGTFTYPIFMGGKYVGEFKDGKMNGKGTFIYGDGTKFSGDYFDDEMWMGIKYDEDGKIIFRVVNGEVIRK